MPGPQRSEPLEFACGDTLWFYRFLPEYSSEDGVATGWTLTYQLFTLDGLFTGISFTAEPSNMGFEVSVPNFAAALDPTIRYRLAGYVTNTTIEPGQTLRHQVYDGNLTLTPNLLSSDNVDKFECYEWQQVKSLRCVLLQLNQSYLNETDIQRVRVLREKRKEMRIELNFWEERLKNYLDRQKIKNGQPDPSLIRTVFTFGF